jgi:hypothetical protein
MVNTAKDVIILVLEKKIGNYVIQLVPQIFHLIFAHM